ncbi:hypothetical protein DdX_13389 [Ditylenchus destructor]|uniref:Uncharacterized protein n=1 Tax=Ditylenchus destructor TaxID=166010 RepID=A0AAD4MVB7_9BILA|nr:hypothetical protein DdX_13389 [Ditylenchus destructor]
MPLPRFRTIWERVLRPRPKSYESKPRKCKNPGVPASGVTTPKNALLDTPKNPLAHNTLKKRSQRAKVPKERRNGSKENKENKSLFEIWPETWENKPRKCKLPIPRSKTERSKISPSMRRGRRSPKKSNRNIDSKVTSKSSSVENKGIKTETSPIKVSWDLYWFK